MRPTLGNYVDSINNPNGHFKTLDKVFALRTKEGDPLFTVSSKIARFNVDWQGRRSTLCCFLSNLNAAKSRYKILALQMESLVSPFLTRWDYLEEEILVFDDRGNSRWCDVILQREPEGELLDAFIRRCCRQNDGASLRKLLVNVYEMSLDFYNKGFVHRAITPINIVVKHDLTPVLINYRASHVISTKSTAVEKNYIDDDNLTLAILAIVLYITSYQPSIYSEFRGIMLFRRPNLRHALPKLYEFADAANIEPVKDIVTAILNANDKLKDRLQLNKYLLALLECDLEVYLPKSILVEGLDEIEVGDATNYEPILFPENDAAPPAAVSSMSDIAWASRVSDTLICVMNNNKKWHYLNKDGFMAFNAEFDKAEDFVEGRAVVLANDYYGIINRSGQYVIPPVCEDIAWYGEYGIAVASLDGKYSLRNRDGEIITTSEYEWIGELGDGVLPAKSNDKYGFIDINGKTSIEFIFDDAYGFTEGLAVVAQDGREFEINLNGERVQPLYVH